MQNAYSLMDLLRIMIIGIYTFLVSTECLELTTVIRQCLVIFIWILITPYKFGSTEVS